MADEDVEFSERERMRRSRRFEALDEQPVNQDSILEEWAEGGFVMMDGPNDPDPSVTVEDGRIIEMDGTEREEFDLLDRFIADRAIDPELAERAVDVDSAEFARRIVDVDVPRREVVELASAMTPAKLTDVVSRMNTLEMMMGLQKMRARETPGNQCHVTNLDDNPVQIAADAAEAALRGFNECETTAGVLRCAPLNALAQQIGTQIGRRGTLTQCAVEEATELELGMRGLTGYTGTASIYGTEEAFEAGDDTPWSKAFLMSVYESRGLKVRFTSGSGSEANMAKSEGKSMVYLEARCAQVAKAAGVQGLQNGGSSCIAIPAAVPAGIHGVVAENLLAGLVGLEMATGNDHTFTHSEIRKTARTLPQLLAGTDLIFSGYGSVPNYDNLFAGSNFDSDDYDDYALLQRDLAVDGGLRPVDEETVIDCRNRAARALQVVFDRLDLPPISDEEVEAAAYADGSEDMPERNQADDVRAAQNLLDEGVTGLDVVRILARNGFEDAAGGLLDVLKTRAAGDYLQTSATCGHDSAVVSAVNDANEYRGPGTGYRIDDERWEEIADVRNATDPEDI